MSDRKHNRDNTPARDRAWGRWYSKRGTARVLVEAEKAPSAEARRVRWFCVYMAVPMEKKV